MPITVGGVTGGHSTIKLGGISADGQSALCMAIIPS